MLTSFMVRTLIALILVLAFFAGLGALGWHFVKEQIYLRPEYRLQAERIVVSPPPDWIPDQFVEEVLRTSGLNRTGSLLDKALPQKLAEAFIAYPWIERVEQVVLRHPSGAEVKLVYRVPVALVEIPQRGIVPVDRNGIVLPPEYLTDADADLRDKLLLIQGIQSLPLGAVGTPWGDPQVQTAAQLAEALTDVAEHLNLAKITPAMEAMLTGTRIACRLQTVAGTAFYWGAFTPDDPRT